MNQSPPRWSAIPAQRSSIHVLRWRYRIVLGLVLVAVVSGPAAMLLALGSRANTPQAPEPSPGSPASALAELAVRAWYAREPYPVPAPEDLLRDLPSTDQTDRVESVFLASAGTERLVRAGRSFEVHRFLAASTLGNHLVEVTVDVTDPDHPWLAAHPTLLPARGTPSGAKRFDWTGWSEQVSVSRETEDRLQDWAEAFFGNDPDRLKELTGDPSGRRYPTLRLKGEPTIRLLGKVPVVGSEDRAVVRVLVTIQDRVLEYDVEVVGFNTAAPRVVRWVALR